MKKLFIVAILVTFCTMSCSESDSLRPNQEVVVETISINLPSSSSRSGQAETVEVEFAATIDLETEFVISYEVSKNLLELVKMNSTEFDEYLRTAMGEEYYSIFEDTPSSNSARTDSDSPHSECMGNCDEEYRNEAGDKMPGMGRCRWRCWVDTTVRTLDAILPL